ncbi:GNAT family N-acetyltransferase [Sphingomonas sp. M1A8_2b]
MTTQRIALKLQVGARTLATIPRSLVRIPYSLADALAAKPLLLPALPTTADGYLVTSLPESLLPRVDGQALEAPSLIRYVRQRYVRYHIDLRAGVEAWLAGLSASARSGMKRKAKKLAAANGGMLDVRAYRTVDAFAVFHPLARRVSSITYQEKRLGSGLPDDPDSVRRLSELAAADRLRAWLLFVGGAPIAYLCCTADRETLLYEYVGHDPSRNDLSPGAVLQVEALQQVFAEGIFARFDFTEGEGQHKRQFATGGVACVDLLLLRPTIANRVTTIALDRFDQAIALAKRATGHPSFKRLTTVIRR